MKTNKVFVNMIKEGEYLKDQIFLLSRLKQDVNDYSLELSDSSGSIRGVIPKDAWVQEFDSFNNCVVSIRGVVLIEQGTIFVKLKNIVLADKSMYASRDIFLSIPDDVLKLYQSNIQKQIERVNNPNYKQLLHSCFTQEAMSKMYLMPATISQHCTLRGGMLEAIALITTQVVDFGVNYVKLANRIYSSNLNWDLLITASLLHNYGNFDFFTEEYPFKRTDIGIHLGYTSTLQGVIDEIIISTQNPITKKERAVLFGLLNQVSGYKADSKAVCNEGIILKGIFELYAILDMCDFEKSGNLIGSGVVYSPKMRRYIDTEQLTLNESN